MDGLRGTGFYRLWLGDFLSTWGTSMITFAVPIIGVEVLHLDSQRISWVVSAGLAAPLVVSLSAGVLADRLDRLHVLHLCNGLQFVIYAVMTWLLVARLLDWPLLALLLFASQAIQILYESALEAAIPAIVPESQLMRADSWIEGGISVNQSFGPTIAGMLIQFSSYLTIPVFNTVSFILNSLLIGRLPLDRNQNREEKPGRGSPTGRIRAHLRDIGTGFTLIWSNGIQRDVLVAATIYNLFNSWIDAIFGVYELKVLGFTPTLMGVVMIPPTLAGLAASILAPKLGSRLGPGATLTRSFLVIAIAGALLPLSYFAPRHLAAVLIAFVLSCFEGCIVINMIIGRTMNQTFFSDENISKAMGTKRFISWGFDPLGALLGGMFSAWLGVSASVTIAGFGFIPAAIVCAASANLRGFNSLPTTTNHTTG